MAETDKEIKETPEAVEKAMANEAENPEAEMQGAPVEKQPRELFFERVRTNFPEGKYDEDEEEYYRNGMRMFDDYETDAEEVRGKMSNLFKRFEDDPAAAATMADFLEGTPLPVALRRYFDDDELTAQEGDEYFDDYKKAGEERNKHRDEVNKIVEEIKKNSAESEKNFKEYADETGLSEEEADAMWSRIEELATNMGRGLYSKDFLNMMHKGRAYDSDVEAAEKAGETRGRNEKIVEKLEKPKGDGLPEPGRGKMDTPNEKKLPGGVRMFKDIASRMSKSKWDE